MPGDHAKYSPSKLPRIIKCPGSVLATDGMEDTESSYAAEGTMLHAVTEKAIPHGGSLSQTLIDQFKLNEGQIDAVNDVLDFVTSLKMAHDCQHFEYIESHVSLKGYAKLTGCPGLADVAGTLDYSLAFPKDRVVYIIDWKYGVGEVFPNTPQLKAYAMGLLDSLDQYDYYKNCQLYDKVILTIGQPRLFGGEPFKTEETTPAELKTWMEGTLVPAINNADNESTTLNPSEDACRWCLVKNTCKARRDMATTVAENIFAVHAKLPNKTKEQEIVDILLKAKDIRQYLSDIELHVAQEIQNGVEFPGFKMVAGRSLRKWADEKAMLDFALFKGFTRTDMSVSKIMSPSQAEKKLGRIIAKAKDFLALITKPPGKPTLVRDNDKRKALQFGSAESKFAEFAEGGKE